LRRFRAYARVCAVFPLCLFLFFIPPPQSDGQENSEDSPLETVSAEINAINKEDDEAEGLDEKSSDGGEIDTQEEVRELSPEEKAALKEKQNKDNLTNLDITTSTLKELAEWSKELGLGEGGGREELAGRIRMYYGIISPVVESGQRIITIEKAQSTEYFTLDAVDEEYARLSGGVRLNLKDGDAIHKIKAWDILFNRTRNIVYASGTVEYVKEQGGTIETFSGESFILNLDSWVGDFINTVSERAMEGSETAYRFAGQVISKTDKETTVLKSATISNAKTDEPYWSLNATRLWLLPGSDWAVFNAILKVGEIPVLWLPVFAYPMDEVIFHPVLGTRSREGAFAQTTTYFFGRRTADPAKESSLSKIMGGGSDMAQVRQGIFLRSTGKKDPKPNDKKLSLLLDSYANLGFYTGINFVYPGTGIFKKTDISVGLGWTKTIYQYNGFWTPFNTSAAWDEDWNHSYLLGAEVPFRYRMNAVTAISGKYGTVDFKFPFYADPFIDYDVMNRAEDMNWLELVSGTQDENALTWPPSSTIGSHEWNITARPSISLPALAPYISTLSIQSISSVLSFSPSNNRSTMIGTGISIYSPERIFFMPDKLTAYSISTSINGTPLTLGGGILSSKKEESKNPLKNIGEPIAPWDDKNPPGQDGALNPNNEFVLAPPALGQIWTLPRNDTLRFSINYALSPSSATEFQYIKNVLDPKDVKWNEYQSILTNFRTDGSTTFNLTESSNNLFSTSFGFSGSYQWQAHSYINEDVQTASQVTSLRRADYRGRQWSLNSNYNAQINPFYWSTVWKNTNIQYTLNALTLKSLFNEEQYNKDLLVNPKSDSPEWDIAYGDWTREKISAHRLSANLGARIFDKDQDLRFYTDLPPLYKTYNTDITTRIWITESNAKIQFREDTESNQEADKRAAETKYHYINGYILGNLALTETLRFTESQSLRFYGVYDPELYQWINFTSSLTLWSFKSEFTATRMYKYYYDSTVGQQGWKQNSKGDQDLQPYTWTLGWAPSYKLDSLFGGYFSLTFNMNSSILLDLQRYTYSKFSFNLNLTLGITKFLDFTMGITSENAYIYRYMQDIPMFSSLRDQVEVPGEKNVFVDLVNSFRFDDEKLRQSSGFKLKSFKISTVHHLGDWDAKLSVDFMPYLDNTRTSDPSAWQYKFKTTISFLVQWIPVSEIKTEIDYQNDKFVRKAAKVQ
jgi:hypothetical protein